MKKALVIGGGSENGRTILDVLLDNNFDIINFGSSVYQQQKIKNITINWDCLDIESVHKNFSRFGGTFDFVFFNQNSSSLRLADHSVDHDDILEMWRRIKDWQKSHWLSCQLPFLILHTIRKNLSSESKVGWMLSGYIDYNNSHSTDFADYSSFKYFNHLSMKSFALSNQFKTFGIYPTFSDPTSKEKLKNIIDTVINEDQSDAVTEFRF
jgi:hypothetical protein